MPIHVTTSDNQTTVALVDRCALDDVNEALASLQESILATESLAFDFSRTESVDTSTMQFLISASQTCQRFASQEDPYFQSLLTRWGLTN